MTSSLLSLADKTEILIEALPYIRRYEGTVFVVKYGGAAMIDEELEQAFAQDVTLLSKVGIRIVIVHGGGKEVTEIADKLGITTQFIEGQRYTDAKMMDVVQMVLAGKTNKDVVGRINVHHGDAVGLCGIDANVLVARQAEQSGVDLGFVGEIVSVNTVYLKLLLDHGFMPVIAPIGVDDRGQAYNINADVAAAEVARALSSEKLVYLSDVEGVKAGDTLIHSMTKEEAARLIHDKVITNGMIPKIRSASAALDGGVRKVHLIDGRIRHSLLLEIFTDAGIGTELIRSLSNQPLEVLE